MYPVDAGFSHPLTKASFFLHLCFNPLLARNRGLCLILVFFRRVLDRLKALRSKGHSLGNASIDACGFSRPPNAVFNGDYRLHFDPDWRFDYGIISILPSGTCLTREVPMLFATDLLPSMQG